MPQRSGLVRGAAGGAGRRDQGSEARTRRARGGKISLLRTVQGSYGCSVRHRRRQSGLRPGEARGHSPRRLAPTNRASEIYRAGPSPRARRSRVRHCQRMMAAASASTTNAPATRYASAHKIESPDTHDSSHRRPTPSAATAGAAHAREAPGGRASKQSLHSTTSRRPGSSTMAPHSSAVQISTRHMAQGPDAGSPQRKQVGSGGPPPPSTGISPGMLPRRKTAAAGRIAPPAAPRAHRRSLRRRRCSHNPKTSASMAPR